MPLKIKELPQSERPYEKLKMYGESTLSNAELFAILIKTGTKDENSLIISQRLLQMVESLQEIQNLSIENLTSIKGIGEVKAIQIKALCEIAKRMNKPIKNIEVQIRKPKDIADLLMNEMKSEKQEIVKVALLNTKNRILKIKDIAMGGSNSATVTPNQILTEAVKAQAPKIIIVHNHPSGDPTPSASDYDFTKRVFKAAKILGIDLLDHIVIGNEKYESIFSKGDFVNELNRL